MLAWILLVASGTCGALASILLKTAKPVTDSISESLPALLTYGAAVLVYGLGFVMYAIALKRLPLTLAYPAMIATTMLEVWLWGLWSGEPLMLRGALGAALILLGAWLVVR
jgi:small multidrug resistance pump